MLFFTSGLAETGCLRVARRWATPGVSLALAGAGAISWLVDRFPLAHTAVASCGTAGRAGADWAAIASPILLRHRPRHGLLGDTAARLFHYGLALGWSAIGRVGVASIKGHAWTHSASRLKVGVR